MRDADEQRRRCRVRALLLAAERRPADIDGSEERARRGVVGPDLFLVGEDRLRDLLRDDHGWHPCALAVRGSCLDVVRPREPDRLEALEAGLVTGSAEVGGQVRVVRREPFAQEKWPLESGLGPNATAGSPSETRPFSEYHGIVPIGPPAMGRALGIGADDAVAVTGAPARVRRLRPAVAGVEREVHARDADARSERAGVVGAGVAVLHIDVVVRARDHDVGVVRIDRQRGLVLLVLRERARVTADRYGRVAAGRSSGESGQGQRQRGHEQKRQDLVHGLPFLRPRGPSRRRV